jgi:hypothetical protein
MGGTVGESVAEGRSVRVGLGVGESVAVGLSVGSGEVVGIGVSTSIVGMKAVGGSVGNGAKTSSITLHPLSEIRANRRMMMIFLCMFVFQF